MTVTEGEVERTQGTHVDILGQKLIRHLVLIQDVVVDTCTRKSATEEKPKDSGHHAKGQVSRYFLRVQVRASQPGTAKDKVQVTRPRTKILTRHGKLPRAS